MPVITHCAHCEHSQWSAREVDAGLIVSSLPPFWEVLSYNGPHMSPRSATFPPLLRHSWCSVWYFVQIVNKHVDAAGSEEQCAEAGAEEPVPEDQEGATSQHQRRRESSAARPPLWHRRTQVSLYHESSFSQN